MALNPSRTPLTRTELAHEAFAAAQAITNDWHRSRATRQMAALLPPDCVPAALELARAMLSPMLRARTLMAVAMAAPPDDKAALLAEAAQAIDSLPTPAERAGPLSVLALRLSGEAAAAAAQAGLAGAAELVDENDRGWTIVDLLPSLPTEARLTALSLLRGIREGGIRAAVLGHAVPHLPEALQAGLQAEALAQARAITEPEARARTLASLLPVLPDSDRPAAATEALAAAADYNDAMFWARTVQWTAAASLPLAAREAAYTTALVLPTVEACAEALGPLALVTPASERAPRLAEALRIAGQVPDDWGRAFAISRFAGALTPELFDDALAAARAIGDAWARSDLLVDLTAAMPPAHSAHTLVEALDAARACVAAWPRARALTGVAGKWA